MYSFFSLNDFIPTLELGIGGQITYSFIYSPPFEPRPAPPPELEEDEFDCFKVDAELEDVDELLPDLLLRRNKPEKQPALSDSINVVFPTPLWPNTFIFIFGIGEVEGINCSM